MAMIPLSEQEWKVPAETARIVQALLPANHPYRVLREQLGNIYRDEVFADLYGWHGPAAESPGRLALVVVLQFAEGLTDIQAADAVRTRLDWKYLLGLELTDPGFDASVLSEFRTRVVDGEAAERLLNVLLEALRARGLLAGHAVQRTDSTHVLHAVRDLNRLEMVGETLRAALNALAEDIPDWLQAHVPPVWYERYAQRFEQYRLPHVEAERQALAEQIGADGISLWEALGADVRQVPALQVLRRVWLQNFTQDEGLVHWREKDNIPPAAQAIITPFDVESRYSHKRDMDWKGFKVHVTETCGPGGPHLITHVTTTLATQQDVEQTAAVQQALQKQDLLPREHIVDTGYMSTALLVSSTARGVDLVGRLLPDHSPQARSHPAYAAAEFHVDWQAHVVTCPQGKRSQRWSQRDQTRPAHVRFAPADCAACPAREECVRSARPDRPRTLELQARPHYEAQQAARAYQHSAEFKARYARRAGVEATLSLAVRAFDLRASRYIGLAKTHLQQVAISAAINLQRFTDWVTGTGAKRGRYSAFTALQPQTLAT